jgi:hypothetical protein
MTRHCEAQSAVAILCTKETTSLRARRGNPLYEGNNVINTVIARSPQGDVAILIIEESDTSLRAERGNLYNRRR